MGNTVVEIIVRNQRTGEELGRTKFHIPHSLKRESITVSKRVEELKGQAVDSIVEVDVLYLVTDLED